MPRFASLLAAALVLFASPSLARAHGGPPIVETLAFDPGDPMHVFAGTNFGTITSSDGGASWTWVCPAAVQLQTATEDPIVLVSDMGSPFIGDTAGLWRGSHDACSWSSVLDMPGYARAGAVAHGGPGVLFAGTSIDGGSNTVRRSTDDGVTWTPVLGPTVDVWFESIAVAPSDPMRVYAVSNLPPQRTEPWVVTVYRSEDGGDHWTSFPFTVLTHEWRLYLLGVDPTNPDRILAHTQDLYAGDHERVMLSEDGGATWNDVLELVQVLGGAWAPDGSSAYIAAPVDGLWRSDDSGHTFAAIRPDLYLRCVVADATSIWVCADDFSAHFAIGRSTDRGATFDTIARLRSITGPVACGATTTVGTSCADHTILDMALAIAPDPAADAGVADAGASDASTDDAGIDASVGPPPATHGCGCSIQRRSVDGAWIALALACTLAFRDRERRSRGRLSDGGSK